MSWLWLYLAGLLLAVVAIKVLVTRALRAERRRFGDHPNRRDS